MINIFIDGDTGTTALKIHELLETRDTINFVSLPESERKNKNARKQALNSCDLAILCLPDDAARQAVAMIEQTHVRVIDASTAHRIAPDWVFGFPEYAADQRDKIAAARLVANPGCYAIAAISLLAPLVQSGLLAGHAPLSIFAASGYSGGGKKMLAEHEAGDLPPHFFYRLGGNHKHLPEITHYSGLTKPPIFVPSVGAFAQGMVVAIPLPQAFFNKPTAPATIMAAWQARFGEGRKVYLQEAETAETDIDWRLAPMAQAGDDRLALQVFRVNGTDDLLAVAGLDNLLKGAAANLVQNMELMFPQIK